MQKQALGRGLCAPALRREDRASFPMVQIGGWHMIDVVYSRELVVHYLRVAR